MKILYLGRAPCTKETLPDFREKCRVTRHSRTLRGLTSSQRTPGFWGVTIIEIFLFYSPIKKVLMVYNYLVCLYGPILVKKIL